MPQPSSVTAISERPPSRTTTSMRVAPASRAFSTSSLTAAAGRSTTSPAAMRLTRVSGRRRIVMDQHVRIDVRNVTSYWAESSHLQLQAGYSFQVGGLHGTAIQSGAEQLGIAEVGLGHIGAQQ